MSPEDCSRALASVRPGVAFGTPRPILGGWSYHTFAVDGFIVRFPVSENDAANLVRELRLLPELEAALPVAVPRYEITGDWQGSPFGAYPAIAGRGMDEGAPPVPGSTLWIAIGATLRALHALPKARAEAILGSTPGDEALSAEADASALALLPAHVRDVARSRIARYVAMDHSADATLTHNDLGLVHILANEGRISGIIDWSDACIGDPAKDFVGILAGAGWPAVHATLAAYGPVAPDFEERIAFFSWIAPIHDILYGLATDQPEHVTGGILGVEERMRFAGVIP